MFSFSFLVPFFACAVYIATIMDKSLGTLLHFWGVFQFTQVEPLTPQTMLDACIQNLRVSTLYRLGGERELQANFEKDALF